jgi:hypothetical protein
MWNLIRNNMNDLLLKTTSHVIDAKKKNFLRSRQNIWDACICIQTWKHLFFIWDGCMYIELNIMLCAPHPRLTTDLYLTLTSTKHYIKGSPSQWLGKATFNITDYHPNLQRRIYFRWLELHRRSVCGVRSSVSAAGEWVSQAWDVAATWGLRHRC